MTDIPSSALLDAVLDSWDRNNTILINLLRAVPEAGMDVRGAEGSPSVRQMFTHMHVVRLIFIRKNAPDFSRSLPEGDWRNERDRERIVQMLEESARAVRDTVRGMVESGRAMKVHYDHPMLFMQHLIWHEGYHHGQIKLALKLAGMPLSDDDAGAVTWDVWLDKTSGGWVA